MASLIRRLQTKGPDAFTYIVGGRDQLGVRITKITKERGGYKIYTKGGGDIFIPEGDVK